MQLLQDTDAAVLYSLAKVPTPKAQFRRQAWLQLPGPTRLGSSKAIGGICGMVRRGGDIYSNGMHIWASQGSGLSQMRSPCSEKRQRALHDRRAQSASRGRAQPCPDPSWGAPASRQRMRKPTPHRRGPPQSLTPRLTPRRYYTAKLMECNPWPSAQRAGRPNLIVLFTMLCCQAKDPRASQETLATGAQYTASRIKCGRARPPPRS